MRYIAAFLLFIIGGALAVVLAVDVLHHFGP